MTAGQVRNYLLDCGCEGAIVFDDFAEAFAGTTPDGLAVYDYNKMVEMLMRRMSEQDAKDYIDFNVINIRLGEKTPVILFPPVI